MEKDTSLMETRDSKERRKGGDFQDEARGSLG